MTAYTLATKQRPARRRTAMLVGGFFAFFMTSPLTAFAHAELVDANPAQGAVLTTMPTEVSLTLNEDVREPAFVTVTAEDGQRVSSEDIQVAGTRVSTAIAGDSPSGTYQVAYRIVSTDSHIVTGESTFEVTSASSVAQPPTTTAPPDDPAPSAAAAPSTDFSSSGASTTSTVLIVSGFIVVAMIGLVLIIRAGMRSSGADHNDA